MYRAASPYGQAESSYPVAAAASTGYPAAVNGSVQPGDTTFTQVMTPDGRVLYQVFRASPASYQTANGVINGVQWVAQETVPAPPPGSRPANADFVNSWVRSGSQTMQSVPVGVPVASSSKSSKEKDSGKRSHHRKNSEYDASLHDAREKDARDHRRTSSYNGSMAPSAIPFPGGGSGYPGYQPPGVYGSQYAPYGDPNAAALQPPYGAPSGPYGIPTTGSAYSDIDRRMGDLDINRSRESTSERERDRKVSEHRRSRKASTHEPSRPSDPYAAGPYGAPGGVYGAPGYVPYPGVPVAASTHSNPSPNVKPGEVPYSVPGGFPVAYASSNGGRPRANSTAARPDVYALGPGSDTGAAPRSRAASPNPQSNLAAYPQARPQSRIGGPSPHMPPGSTLPASQLAAPEAFSRAINAGLPYIPFKPTKVSNMDGFFSHMPKMPSALETHDVRNEDWFRFMEDLTLAWTGRLPVSARDPKPPRPSVVTAELIHTWNTAFFEPRGVEIVLYKGKQRRSGRLFGRADITSDDDEDESSSSSESSSESDDPYPPAPSNAYGRSGGMEDLAAARRRYYDGKIQAKERRRERRRRRRERRKNKVYTFYATFGPNGVPAGMPPVASSYPGMVPTMGVPPPVASSTSSKKSKKHRSGSHY
ncbi:hypothetical protein H1R20_g10885, partial [Candolleomyces eurysporus]